jgi:hypothetical protein
MEKGVPHERAREKQHSVAEDGLSFVARESDTRAENCDSMLEENL